MNWSVLKRSTLILLLMGSTINAEEPNKTVWINVFVHGIISIKPYLTISNVVRLIRDKIADSIYARSVEKIRKDPFFYQYHAMQGLGLKPIDMESTQKGAGATAFARIYEDIRKSANPNSTEENLYYTFGWSGLLSPRIRYMEAKFFYDHLLKLYNDVRKKNINVKIRIVGYSHGGNVALTLGEIFDRTDEEKFFVDELILVGVPIIPDSDYCIASPMFKQIYHFFSFGDRIQPLDCFGLNRFFSSRRFKRRSYLKLPHQLQQIRVKIKRPAFDNKFIPSQKYTLEKLLSRRTNIRNADPGHSELWSFGWTASNFRKSFPLNPLPFAAFIPHILHKIEKNKVYGSQLMVEIHPHYEHMIIYDYSNQQKLITPFVSLKEMNRLKKEALSYKPDDFTVEKFEQHIERAMKEAEREFHQDCRRSNHKHVKDRMLGTHHKRP